MEYERVRDKQIEVLLPYGSLRDILRTDLNYGLSQLKLLSGIDYLRLRGHLVAIRDISIEYKISIVSKQLVYRGVNNLGVLEYLGEFFINEGDLLSSGKIDLSSNYIENKGNINSSETITIQSLGDILGGDIFSRNKVLIYN